MNSTPPNNFAISKRSILKSGDFNKSHKSVRFDKSVSYQQLQMEEERKLKERELQRDQKEQEEAEEFYRMQNGVPHVNDFSRPEINALVSRMSRVLSNLPMESPIPADPRHAMMERNFQISPPRTSSNTTYTPVNFGESRFGAIGSERKRNNEQQLNASARFDSSRSSFASSSQRLSHNNFHHHHLYPAPLEFSSSFVPARENFTNSRQSFSTSRNTSLKKALCIEWRDHQTCRYGATCKYAHGIEELGLPNIPKKKTCHFVERNQVCPYGAQCRYSHSPIGNFQSSATFSSSFVRSHRNL